MNSLYRERWWGGLDGVRVQADAMIAASGEVGQRAVKKWEKAFYDGEKFQQGAVHLREGELCGVPGWVACYRNPFQRSCQCPVGKGAGKSEDGCVEELFSGKRKGFSLYQVMNSTRTQKS